jgi:purine-nucleoside/S-methyl-5'-thioadenosine phosphorylase / adenosine deaminase
MEWRERDGVRWLEAELGDRATACFSTRVGGASAPPFDLLNLGLLTGDEAASVRENRRRLTAALDRDPEGVLFGHQVHEASVSWSDEAPDPNPWLGDAAPAPADGQATSAARLTPLVQVADCLPVAISGPGGVAMLHCGWRGLAGGIVAEGVFTVGADSAAIGPGIGPCCYEVGDEVLAEFEPLGAGIANGRMLDLPEAARRLLADAGVDRVEPSGLCTSCEADLFFSHRRDGERTGRQAGLVWMAGGA